MQVKSVNNQSSNPKFGKFAFVKISNSEDLGKINNALAKSDLFGAIYPAGENTNFAVLASGEKDKKKLAKFYSLFLQVVKQSTNMPIDGQNSFAKAISAVEHNSSEFLKAFETGKVNLETFEILG